MSVNQKGTALEGGAASEEALASSHSIFDSGQHGGQKGLQQFYSPPELARLVRRVIDGDVAVLDPTAGDGMLMSEFPRQHRFGVELDKDQIANAKDADRGYTNLRGDIQHVYPLLSKAVPEWHAIVANPPFGLQWSDKAYKNGRFVNSTVLTFAWCVRLLADEGQLAFVAGRDRFYRQIAKMPEARSIYAVVECDELFEGTSLPCVVAFGLNLANRSVTSEGFETRKVPLDMLDLVGDWVKELREKALGEYNDVRSWESVYGRDRVFDAVQAEHDRRLEGRVKANREYDALLINGGKTIQWLPSSFATLAIRNRGAEDAIYGLNGQALAYFSTNESSWNMLRTLESDGIITIEPKLIDAVEDSLVHVRRERVPMYELKPQMRLGFLTDLEFVRCKKADPDKGFHEGENYRIVARPTDVQGRFTEQVESKKNPGEYDTRIYETLSKALNVRIGHYSFNDTGDKASTNIQWMIDHFDIPNPGDVAKQHPDEMAKARELVEQVFDLFEANSRAYEEKHPHLTPFSRREFQIEDIARLVFKNGGMLSWEQGLGKTLGALAFAYAQWLLGKQKTLFVATANDLVPQWKREIKRFLGMDATLITGHGQAHAIAKRLRDPEEGGIFLATYSTLSIKGTRSNNLLPTVTVREWQEDRKVKGTGKWDNYVWADVNEVQLTEDQIEEMKKQAIEIQRQAFIERGKDPDEYAHSINRQWPSVAVHQLGFIQLPCSYGTPNALHGYIIERTKKITKKLTSRDLCPACESDLRNGWTGIYCEAKLPSGTTCGYSHYAVKMKPIASRLSTAFRRGVGVYDEIQMIQSKALNVPSKRSRAMQGIKFGSFLGMSGTPIKNYIDQAFWPLWKSLGNANHRFGYNHDTGPLKFATDFCVVKWDITSGRKENRGFMPEVSNLSLFWRMLASSSIRRRKEETGEVIVPKYYHEIRFPLGYAQAQQIREWLLRFPDLFAEKYPDHGMVKSGMHKVTPGLLGLNWKLDYACTMPESDPDREWTEVEGLSNYTPANLGVLQLTMALVKEGRKVLVGSNLKTAGPWLAERLREKGVNALDIVDEAGDTLDPDERAEVVHDFQTDPNVQVFCAGTSAIRLGHNLDAADAVIINGLDFDYETYDQFIARIHRLTSKNPVDVFVILPSLEGQDTITTRKWDLLAKKGGSVELALDGRLIIRNEHEVSLDEVLRELMEKGLQVTDEAVDEVSVEEEWARIPNLEEFVSEGVIPARPIDDEAPTELGGVAADSIGKFLRAIWEASQDQLSLTVAPDTVDDSLLLQQNELEMAKEEYEDWLQDDELDELELVALATNSEDTPVGELEADGDKPAGEESDVPLSAPDTDPPADNPTEGEFDGTSELPASDEPSAESGDWFALGDELETLTADDEEPGTQDDPLAGTELPPSPALDPVATLKGAKELLDLGIIEADEFQAIKEAQIALMKGGAS